MAIAGSPMLYMAAMTKQKDSTMPGQTCVCRLVRMKYANETTSWRSQSIRRSSCDAVPPRAPGSQDPRALAGYSLLVESNRRIKETQPQDKRNSTWTSCFSPLRHFVTRRSRSPSFWYHQLPISLRLGLLTVNLASISIMNEAPTK